MAVNNQNKGALSPSTGHQFRLFFGQIHSRVSTVFSLKINLKNEPRKAVIDTYLYIPCTNFIPTKNVLRCGSGEKQKNSQCNLKNRTSDSIE